MAQLPLYDLIILDLRLPDGSGASLLTALRGTGVQTPVIVLTAWELTDGEQYALSQAGVELCRKPLVGNALVRAIRKGASQRWTPRPQGVGLFRHVQDEKPESIRVPSHPARTRRLS
jgi:DNA-binding response OmpR family regulator